MSPLDDFELTEGRLCMTDLAVRYGFAKGGSVEWLRDGEVQLAAPVDAQGKMCVKLQGGDAYSVFRLHVRRGDVTRPPLELHFKAGAQPRILGLIRVAR